MKNLWEDSFAQYLLTRINKHPSGCWLWKGPFFEFRGGYGKLKMRGKWHRAHRAFYMIEHGEVPEHLYILHKCNNPLCVNPEHLYAGTQFDNMRDRKAAGGYGITKADRIKARKQLKQLGV